MCKYTLNSVRSFLWCLRAPEKQLNNDIYVVSSCIIEIYDLDREIMDFYKYLDRDFSSQPYLLTFCASKLASKWAKSVGNSNFFQKISTKISIISKKHGYLNLSR